MKIKKMYQGQIPENKILNTQSQSPIDTYSCNYINKLNKYSTDEVKIGIWINDKPIYRKVIDIGNLPSKTGTNSVSHNIENIDNFTSVKGIINNGLEWFEFNSVYRVSSAGTNYDLGLLANKTNIIYTTLTDRSAYKGIIILEYTKTTD